MADPQTHDRDDLTQPNAEHRYEVTVADLPLSCPMPQMYLWNSHPRVYIPVHETGRGKCIYCGAEYVVTDFDPNDPEVATHHRRE
jgi:uncharacterized Zn-finger protein